MPPRFILILFALLATLLFAAFILGLAESISSGFAGFWGGLPFWVITVFVLCLALYDFWEDCVKELRKQR
ncbi:hypothetical protein E1162_03385 [Rhodobacteraceae bacterium RKSG542]|uniref:hypothetical protein n=1 Tax=Pseudovibrio flavus TaxID=2529854 RepID=UPI0012BB987B|nr:hypothetical protein [Pseudovibrio flavus]MTI16280.1 hypothetical protein [Pseudovibrio flavus]